MPKKTREYKEATDPNHIEIEAAIPIPTSIRVGGATPPEALKDEPMFDVNNPRSLINLLPSSIRDYAVRVPKRYFTLSESELELECFDGAKPFNEARRLRIGFWLEYDRVQNYEEKIMIVANIVKGNCGEFYFLKKFLTNQKHLAWMLRAPEGYINALEDIHSLGIKKMIEILMLPVERDDRGNQDTRLMKVQKSIYDSADLRLKGAIVQQVNQTIDQRNLQVNVSGTLGQAKEMLAPSPSQPSWDEIESKIRLLESKSVRLQAPSHIETDLMRDISPPVPENISSIQEDRDEQT